eukprot:6906031-Heterocapsa_arctica.AAC.1
MSIVLNVESTPRRSTSTQQNMFSGEGTFVLQCSDSDNIWTSNAQWTLMDGGIASNLKPEDQD